MNGSKVFNTNGGISIHAPVKGATIVWDYVKYARDHISIHAPVKGATVFRFHLRGYVILFQSTHP